MKRARTTKAGKVEKVIKAVVPTEKDKVEIHIESPNRFIKRYESTMN